MSTPTIISSFAAVTAVIVGCNGVDSSVTPRPPSTPTSNEAHPTMARESFVGVVLPEHSVNIRTKVPGRVVNVPLRLGAHVRAGEALVMLDDRALRDALRVAEARVLGAEANVKRASVELEQARDAAARTELVSEVVAAEELSSARFRVRLAEAGKSSAIAALTEKIAEASRARTAVADTTILAPFAGTIVAVKADLGDVVDADATLARMVSTHEPIVRFAIPPGHARKFNIGCDLKFTADGIALQATLTGVATEVDSASALVFAEAAIANSLDADVLAGGASGRVTLGTGCVQ